MKTKILALLLLVLLLSACKPAVPVTTPTVIPLPLTPTSIPSPTPLPGNQVTFRTEDGVQIAATLYGAGGTAIVLAHQGTPGADQTTWRQFATTLAENGFTAMTFDFRGVGQSGGTLDYALLDKDVRAAVQYLRDQQYRQIVCAGASMGGTACLRVAIDDEPFMGLIILASTTTAGRNDLKILPEEMSILTRPKLFITAKEDSVVVVRDTNRMYDLSPEPKELLLLDGYKHGTSLFQTEVGKELSGAMLDFLKALPSPTATLPSTNTPLPLPIASSTDLVLEAPQGIPPILDGVLSPGEWDNALQQEFTDGGELLLMQSAGYLYLGMHENFKGLTITSVCLEYKDEISILHSSGSLGTAVFKRNDKGWQLTQPFKWDLYGVTSNTLSDAQKRKAFLDKNGWLANLGSMTKTEEIEYQIAIPDEPFRVAVAYLLPPNFGEAAWWPSDLSDDCRKIELLQANIAENLNTPLVLQFAPETWATITIP